MVVVAVCFKIIFSKSKKHTAFHLHPINADSLIFGDTYSQRLIVRITSPCDSIGAYLLVFLWDKILSWIRQKKPVLEGRIEPYLCFSRDSLRPFKTSSFNCIIDSILEYYLQQIYQRCPIYYEFLILSPNTQRVVNQFNIEIIWLSFY